MSTLNLTRRPFEKIMVGDDVMITVMRIKPGQVSLKFEAPEEIAIDRLEVREKREYELKMLPRYEEAFINVKA